MTLTVRAVLTGDVDLDSVELGVTENMALAAFLMRSGVQIYPVYARGLAAIALARYVDVFKEHSDEMELTVTSELDLLAVGIYVMPFAAKIHWHVSGPLRNRAEAAIKADKRHVFENIGIPPGWPRRPLKFAPQSPDSYPRSD
jgi:hypothetical protein